MNIQKFRVKRNKKIYVFLFCLSLFGIFSLYRELNAQVDPSFLIKPEGESSIKIETPTFGSYTFEQGLPLAFKKGKPFYFTESSNPIALLIITLVNWGLRLSGILLFGVLVYTGIVYATSSGDPKKIEQAQARLFESLIGFFLLFSFYIILNTINPDILTVSTEAPITITPPSSEEDLEGPSPETTPPSPPAPENYVDIKSLNLPLTDELKSYPNVWLDVKLAEKLKMLQSYGWVITDACVKINNDGTCETTKIDRESNDCHRYGKCVDIDNIGVDFQTLRDIAVQAGFAVLDEGNHLHLTLPDVTVDSYWGGFDYRDCKSGKYQWYVLNQCPR